MVDGLPPKLLGTSTEAFGYSLRRLSGSRCWPLSTRFRLVVGSEPIIRQYGPRRPVYTHLPGSAQPRLEATGNGSELGDSLRDPLVQCSRSRQKGRSHSVSDGAIAPAHKTNLADPQEVNPWHPSPLNHRDRTLTIREPMTGNSRANNWRSRPFDYDSSSPKRSLFFLTCLTTPDDKSTATELDNPSKSPPLFPIPARQACQTSDHHHTDPYQVGTEQRLVTVSPPPRLTPSPVSAQLLVAQTLASLLSHHS